MKKNRFEEFLQERHGKQYIGTKDCMIDDFENWLSEIDIDQWLNYGEWFGNKLEKEMLQKRISSLELKKEIEK